MSYDASLIATDETYQVRFLIGDTNTAAEVLTDAEIDWLIAQEANVYMAAAAAIDAIVSKMSSATSTTGAVTRKRIGATDVSYANGKTASDYEKLAGRLRARGRGHQVLYAGGISDADKAARNADTDRPRANRIGTGQFNEPTLGPGVWPETLTGE